MQYKSPIPFLSASRAVRYRRKLTHIPGLLSWHKADSIFGLNSGDQITVWPDSSGNGNHFDQGGASSRPTLAKNAINGLPTVRFDGSQGRQMSAANSAKFSLATSSFFCVAKKTSGSAGSILAKNTTAFGDSRRRKIQLSFSGTTNFGYNAGSDAQTIVKVGGYTVATFAVLWVIARSNSDHTLGNGLATQDYPDALGDSSFNTTVVEVGQAFNNGAERVVGDLPEMLFYNRPLSLPEAGIVIRYLASRYAISGIPY